jgi:hypothetical protein
MLAPPAAEGTGRRRRSTRPRAEARKDVLQAADRAVACGKREVSLEGHGGKHD